MNQLARNIIDDNKTSFEFVPSKQFKWSPRKNQIFYNTDEITSTQGVWSLLHELGHAKLGHTTYYDDLQLLTMEVQAWKAAKEIATTYKEEIDEQYINSCIDSYRDWLHKRSKCMECSTHSLQIDSFTYQCHNCDTRWRVPISRFCTVRRTRLA